MTTRREFRARVAQIKAGMGRTFCKMPAYAIRIDGGPLIVITFSADGGYEASRKSVHRRNHTLAWAADARRRGDKRNARYWLAMARGRRLKRLSK